MSECLIGVNETDQAVYQRRDICRAWLKNFQHGLADHSGRRSMACNRRAGAIAAFRWHRSFPGGLKCSLLEITELSFTALTGGGLIRVPVQDCQTPEAGFDFPHRC